MLSFAFFWGEIWFYFGVFSWSVINKTESLFQGKHHLEGDERAGHRTGAQGLVQKVGESWRKTRNEEN